MLTVFQQIKELSKNKEIYIVGGWLRDKILKRQNRDLDIAVKGNSLDLAKKTAKKFNGSLVKLDEENKIYRVVLKNHLDFDYLDFAALRGKTIEDDIIKRDFTINSMALKLGTEKEPNLDFIFDPLKGRSDIKKGLVRMNIDSAFREDPLRLLRAFRFASQLDFKIVPQTAKQIKKDASLILRSAAERSREELFKIFSSKISSAWIEQLDKAGLLEKLFPEIIRMKQSAKKFYFHPNGLWQHCFETLVSLENITSNLKKYFPEHYKQLLEHLNTPLSSGITRFTLLKLVSLLHDIAKPDCAALDGKKMRFIGHEALGAKLAATVLTRLRLSNKEIKIAKILIHYHMRPVSLGQAGILTPRAALRLFRDLGDNVPDLLLLALSDWHSYKRLKTNKPSNLKKQEQTLRELIMRYFKEKEKPAQPNLIDGTVIMKKFNLKPGPIIGGFLKIANEAQGLGKIKTTDEALELIAKNLTRFKKIYKI